MSSVVPLVPEYSQKYPQLVAEAHEALRELLFPGLPACAGRGELMAQLLGTGIGEATYVLDRLHAALRVPGDVVEFGVAQGATSAMLANELRATGRTLWLYDSFQGLPKPAPQDVLKDDIFRLGSIERYEGEMRCDSAEVEERLRRIGIARDRVRIVPGFVETSLREGAGPTPVCFAYIDFDFYQPICHALEYLDRHLSPGGQIVVDDYEFFSLGAKTAVDEFVARRGRDYIFTRPRAFAGHFCMLQRRENQKNREDKLPVI